MPTPIETVTLFLSGSHARAQIWARRQSDPTHVSI